MAISLSTFCRTDSDNFSRLMIFTATFLFVTQWIPILTNPVWPFPNVFSNRYGPTCHHSDTSSRIETDHKIWLICHNRISILMIRLIRIMEMRIEHETRASKFDTWIDVLKNNQRSYWPPFLTRPCFCYYYSYYCWTSWLLFFTGEKWWSSGITTFLLGDYTRWGLDLRGSWCCCLLRWSAMIHELLLNPDQQKIEEHKNI